MCCFLRYENTQTWAQRVKFSQCKHVSTYSKRFSVFWFLFYFFAQKIKCTRQSTHSAYTPTDTDNTNTNLSFVPSIESMSHRNCIDMHSLLHHLCYHKHQTTCFFFFCNVYFFVSTLCVLYCIFTQSFLSHFFLWVLYIFDHDCFWICFLYLHCKKISANTSAHKNKK